MAENNDNTRKRQRDPDEAEDAGSTPNPSGRLGTGPLSVPMPGLATPPSPAQRRRRNPRPGPAPPQTPSRTPGRPSTPRLGATSTPNTPDTPETPGAKGERLFVWKANQRPDERTEYVGLGKRRESLLFEPQWIGNNGIEKNADAFLDQKILPEERKSWLESHAKWINNLGAGWVGKKILGLGQYGVAGLWERPDTVENKGVRLRQVVVKQAGGRKNVVDALREEGRLLGLFKGVADGVGTKHVPRIYRTFFTEMGLGTIPEMDPRDGEVGRIFLEYCQGGDFAGFLRATNKKYTAKEPMPEDLVWSIFKCLALALTVIENGTEALDADSWPREIVHFDIKPANVFIGRNDNEHQKTPVFKIADFGLAQEVPAVQDNIFLWQGKSRGTPAFMAPEQYDPDGHSDGTRRYGTATNVWQIGKVMWNLICRGRTFDQNAELFRIGVDRRKTRTMGWHIIEAPYSAALRKAVLRCLAFSPPSRPSPRDLVRLVDQGIAACDTVAEGLGPIGDVGAGLTEHQEPAELSAAWDAPPEGAVPEDTGLGDVRRPESLDAEMARLAKGTERLGH